MNAYKILIVDDDELVSWTLQTLIKKEETLQVIARAENGRQALDIVEKTIPDLVLLDIQMPIMNGMDCLRELLTIHRELPVLMLTSFNEEHLIVEAIAIGARGYLLKTPEFKGLIRHIFDGIHNEFILPLSVSQKLAHYLSTQKNNAHKSLSQHFVERYSLTATQIKIAEILPLRLSNREIAAQLFLQEGTIKNYISIILEKLEVSNRTEAIRLINRHLI